MSADGLSILVEVTRGEPCGLLELSEVLGQAGVRYIHDDEPLRLLADRLQDPGYEAPEEELRLGLAPASGRPGYFEPRFDRELKPGHVDAEGNIDYFERELLSGVTAGDAIGVLHAPSAGLPGRRVDGAEIPAPPSAPAALQLGPGVQVDPSGTVTATRPGVIRYDPSKSLDVVQYYEHPGDVDLRSGNLDMVGTVKVQGEVHRLFEIRATGDIDIGRGVDGGSALAGGNLFVRGRARGGEGTVLLAEGNVLVKVAEGAVIRSGRMLEVLDAVNSDLVGENIHVLRNIRGGGAIAEHSLVVQNAGSPSNLVNTLLAVGQRVQRPVVSASPRSKLRATERSLLHRAGALQTRPSSTISRGVSLLDAQTRERREQQRALVASAFIEIRGTAQPGVLIQFGDFKTTLERPLRATRLRWDLTQGVLVEEPIARVTGSSLRP
jgi:uncharacterized protein (DUF342 family)